MPARHIVHSSCALHAQASTKSPASGPTHPKYPWYAVPFLTFLDDEWKPGDASIDWLARFRVWAFLAGLTAFVALSINRFSDFAWSEHRLDLVSQADNIGMPARMYLASRQGHAAHIGCLSADPAWPDACDFLWYSMLPYYLMSTPPGMEPAHRYVIFVGDPQAADKPQLQASHVRNYRIEAPLTPEAFLLVRKNP